MSDEDTSHRSGRSIKARPPTTVESISGVAGPSVPSTSTPLPWRLPGGSLCRHPSNHSSRARPVGWCTTQAYPRR